MRRITAAMCVLLAAGSAFYAQSAAVAAQEYELKAAFLFNFAKFVEWPPAAAGAGSTLVIAIFGDDPFAGALEAAVWGKSVAGRSVTVRRAGQIEGLMPCHILFINARERRRVPQVLKAVKGAAVLTMSDMADFLELGGMVRLLTEDGQVRFGVDLGAVRKSGLRISSKLLSLARIVKN